MKRFPILNIGVKAYANRSIAWCAGSILVRQRGVLIPSKIIRLVEKIKALFVKADGEVTLPLKEKGRKLCIHL